MLFKPRYPTATQLTHSAFLDFRGLYFSKTYKIKSVMRFIQKSVCSTADYLTIYSNLTLGHLFLAMVKIKTYCVKIYKLSFSVIARL